MYVFQIIPVACLKRNSGCLENNGNKCTAYFVYINRTPSCCFMRNQFYTTEGKE